MRYIDFIGIDSWLFIPKKIMLEKTYPSYNQTDDCQQQQFNVKIFTSNVRNPDVTMQVASFSMRSRIFASYFTHTKDFASKYNVASIWILSVHFTI